MSIRYRHCIYCKHSCGIFPLLFVLNNWLSSVLLMTAVKISIAKLLVYVCNYKTNPYLSRFHLHFKHKRLSKETFQFTFSIKVNLNFHKSGSFISRITVSQYGRKLFDILMGIHMDMPKRSRYCCCNPCFEYQSWCIIFKERNVNKDLHFMQHFQNCSYRPSCKQIARIS